MLPPVDWSDVGGRRRRALEGMPTAGLAGDLDEWLEFNRTGAFVTRRGRKVVAPFPPAALMQVTTGLEDDALFADQGAHFFRVLDDASPRPLSSFRDVLDFGVGVGRLARLFKGFEGRYTGVDVDARNVAWVGSALDHVEAVATTPGAPLPFEDGRFDCVLSISVFTHMNEADQLFYLSELARVTSPGATLILTVHGERALERVTSDRSIFDLLAIPTDEIDAVRDAFPSPGFRFVLHERGHLTTEAYEYGQTFISRTYVEGTWSRYFDVVDVIPGALHDFQDAVVLTAR